MLLAGLTGLPIATKLRGRQFSFSVTLNIHTRRAFVQRCLLR